jgi:hypothetical protein
VKVTLLIRKFLPIRLEIPKRTSRFFTGLDLKLTTFFFEKASSITTKSY